MKNLASKKYQILDHQADLKIQVYGRNLEELFNNILAVMSEVTRPQILNKELSVQEITIKSENLENLLIDFLSEVIYQMDLNDSIYLKSEFEKLTEKELKGKLFGQKIKKFGTEIKAVTWHDFEIKKDEDGFSATLVFDI